jgi:hypothetical protein
VEPSSLLLRPFIGPLSQPWTIEGDDCGVTGGMNEWQGKPKYSEETCPSAAVSTTDPTWLDPGRWGRKPATNRLRCDTVGSDEGYGTVGEFWFQRCHCTCRRDKNWEPSETWRTPQAYSSHSNRTLNSGSVALDVVHPWPLQEGPKASC